MYDPPETACKFVNEIHEVVTKYKDKICITEIVHELLIVSTLMTLNKAPTRQNALQYLTDCINDAINIYNDIEQNADVDSDE